MLNAKNNLLPHTKMIPVTKWETKTHTKSKRQFTDDVFLTLYLFRNTFSGSNLVKWILGKGNVLMTLNSTASLLWSVSPCFFSFHATCADSFKYLWKTKKFCNMSLVLVCSVFAFLLRSVCNLTNSVKLYIIEFKSFFRIWIHLKVPSTHVFRHA